MVPGTAGAARAAEAAERAAWEPARAAQEADGAAEETKHRGISQLRQYEWPASAGK